MLATSAHIRSDDRTLDIWFDCLVREFGKSLITMLVVATSVTAYFNDTLSSNWQLVQFGGGSWWSFLVCHMTHWTFDQLFWDVLAFGVLGYMCEQTGRLRMLILLAASSVTVSMSVLCSHPELASYRGLSGVDSALFAYFACYVAHAGMQNRDRLWMLGGVACWLIFTGKVTFELVTGQTLFAESSSEFQTLPISHLAGALAGSLVWFFGRVR